MKPWVPLRQFCGFPASEVPWLDLGVSLVGKDFKRSLSIGPSLACGQWRSEDNFGELVFPFTMRDLGMERHVKMTFWHKTLILCFR